MPMAMAITVRMSVMPSPLMIDSAVSHLATIGHPKILIRDQHGDELRDEHENDQGRCPPQRVLAAGGVADVERRVACVPATGVAESA